MDFRVHTQLDLLAILKIGLPSKSDSNKIIEEHPLMRMKLSNLHKRYHLNQFQSSPMLIKLILLSRSVECLGQQKDDILPYGRKQLGQFFSRGSQDKNPNAEEDQNKYRLRCFCILSHLNNLIDKLLSLICVFVFLA